MTVFKFLFLANASSALMMFVYPFLGDIFTNGEKKALKSVEVVGREVGTKAASACRSHSAAQSYSVLLSVHRKSHMCP
ncbi:hypothetical protein DdX_04922 [Ditylenchus destructor]|uniref:Uncharacterized protein n=1 Tax=Ditylenchus destructor TaxID=166010 RepID=A0AAD4NDE0_9BILA|nr:hypothetical protein DdX_04922 [Ditylenchus destructor]